MSEMLLNILKREGIDVFTGAEVVRAIEKSGQKNVTVMLDGKEREFSAREILLAAGRIPNTKIGLDKAGVDLDDSAIRVNDELKTSADNIWAIGDVLGGHMYTHRATYDASIAALNAIKDLGKRRDYRVVPRATFTQQNLASVGLTESEALDNGYEILTGSYDFKNSGKARAIGETDGRVKFIVDAASRQILGAHILGPQAADLIHEAVTAMHNNGTVDSITKSIHIHPTVSEIIKSAAKAVK